MHGLGKLRRDPIQLNPVQQYSSITAAVHNTALDKHALQLFVD